MKPFIAIATAFALNACSSPHEFAISSDEPLQKVAVELQNVRKSKVEIAEPKFATADVWTGDSSGHISVHLTSGASVECKVDYITNGDVEPHIFMIEEGKCVQGLQE